ncbi:MAG: endolytic transglycosylase MltG [Candidatus Doudnabacteria bacterium]|nr:endolytic transglycosylase MltG [Candidatus Doudnabacteria bacterium]
MRKKTIITILLTGLLLSSLFVFYSKFQARKARQKFYQKAQEQKAEEISLTFLEGWNNKEIGKFLETQNILTATEFTKNLKTFSPDLYKNILPEEAYKDWQGFLYPDTYRVFKSLGDRKVTTAEQATHAIAEKMLTNFVTKLPANAKEKSLAQGINLYEAIILASIVEKESNDFPEEKNIIAGIFYNRLKIGMPLQSDATVNYATGKSEASPSLKDLETDSPYNTYKIKGLPPTPITNPSIYSIKAVLNPKTTDYFFYLHNQTTGEPIYSKTFEEHIKNKQKHLK